ncbi:hypothetical protein IF1G_09704 [Cordyceps javanica]|uniref:Uncharacterized protein n=1 Tax=Cordyceps javanica TaxID=43265 RepID=A0A545UQA3_9HYPO|nr:hypothetical protein IF1G_09704 [Cordyceps javanica]
MMKEKEEEEEKGKDGEGRELAKKEGSTNDGAKLSRVVEEDGAGSRFIKPIAVLRTINTAVIAGEQMERCDPANDGDRVPILVSSDEGIKKKSRHYRHQILS